MFYYEDCLEEQLLVTSNQTAFSLQLLWEYTTLMIVNKCAFEGLAASYNLTHNGDVGLGIVHGSRVLRLECSQENRK